MNVNYYFYKLKKEIEFAVGPGRLHLTIEDLNKYLIEQKQKHKRLTWRGVPIRFAIKYTTPLTPKKDPEKIEQTSLI